MFLRKLSLPIFCAAALGLAICLQPAHAVQAASGCGIVGTVTSLQNVEVSPWQSAEEGSIPSALASIETRISVAITAGETPAASRTCATGIVRTYKLCSPTPVKPGDRIHATEATETGSPRAMGCLFDLVVL